MVKKDITKGLDYTKRSMFNTNLPRDSLMIRNFVGGGFKIQCFYCKTFNIIYPQDPDYMHPMLQPCLRQDSALAMFKCIACRQWTKYYWNKRRD
jgi:hypothetical protein